MLRVLAVGGLATLLFALGGVGSGGMPLRPDTSRDALASLGQEYGDLQQWVAAIAQTTDTLPLGDSERARVLADQLAQLILPLEDDFQKTTAALSTAQLDLILPLWERMAFAHAGFVMLQEEAAALGGDPMVEPAELHELVGELSAVLEFAAEMQRQILDQLNTPAPTSIRIS
ncbi:MAG TPA: hypothetical protein VFZ87_10130 [Gemmatimonadales bacterium]